MAGVLPFRMTPCELGLISIKTVDIFAVVVKNDSDFDQPFLIADFFLTSFKH